MATPTQGRRTSAFVDDAELSAAARRSAARSSARVQTTRYYGKEATARLPQREIETEQERPRPELTVVVKRRPRKGAIALVVTLAALLLGVGFVCPVLIGSAATGVESELGRLELQQKELAATASRLSTEVATLSAPDRIAEQALELGLAPAAKVHYLDAAGDVAVSEGDATVAGR